MSTRVAFPRPSRSRVLVAFAAVYLIWGSTYLTISIAVQTMPPFLMAGARFMFGGVLLLLWQLRPGRRGRERLTWVHWRSALIIGACLLLGGNGIVSWGEQYVGSGYMSLIVATVPLWMALLAPLYGGRRARLLAAIGVAVGLVGVGLLIRPGGTFQWQSVAVLASPLLWANGSLYSQRASLPRSALTSTGMEMLAGGALLTIVGLAAGELGRLNVAAISTASWISFVYLIFIGSLVGYTAYIWLLNNVSATAASTYAYVNPLVAVALGAIVLGERITGLTLLAGCMILIAVALILSSRARAAAHRQPELLDVAVSDVA